MNICLVSANYWPGWGGAEGQCRLLAGELHRRGHEVVVLTRARPDAPAEERVDGVSVRRTAAFGRGAVRSLVWTLTAAAWLRRAGRRLQVVQCFQLLSPSHVGVLGRGRSGKQAVLLRPACSGPFGDVAEVRRLPLTRLRQRLLRQADACVTLTRDIEVELAALGLATLPFHRVPNAVDLTLFRPATAEERRRIRVRLGLPEDRVVCVYLGRLVPQKDPELLLDAWFRVARPDAHLALVGDGPLRPRLEARLAAGPSDGRVSLVGATADPAAYLRAADLFALPSRAEGMSNAILEAMACGLPVVATAVGGTSEILAHGEAGLLAPSGDVGPMAENLRRLLGDRALRIHLGERAHDLAQAYSLDRVATQLTAVYASLLGA